MLAGRVDAQRLEALVVSPVLSFRREQPCTQVEVVSTASDLFDNQVLGLMSEEDC